MDNKNALTSALFELFDRYIISSNKDNNLVSKNKQTTNRTQLLKQEKETIEKMLDDFNDFFKDIIKKENNKYADLHEKCQGKKGMELFDAVFEAFIEQQKQKIIEDKQIVNKDVESKINKL